jgi:hypothetical protein
MSSEGDAEIIQLRKTLAASVIEQRANEANLKVIGRLRHSGKIGTIEFRILETQSLVEFTNRNDSKPAIKFFGKVDCVSDRFDYRLKHDLQSGRYAIHYIDKAPGSERSSLVRAQDVYCNAILRAAYYVDGILLTDYMSDMGLAVKINKGPANTKRLELKRKAKFKDKPSSLISSGMIDLLIGDKSVEVASFHLSYSGDMLSSAVTGVEGNVIYVAGEAFPRIPKLVTFKYLGPAYNGQEAEKAMVHFERATTEKHLLRDLDFQLTGYGVTFEPESKEEALNQIQLALVAAIAVMLVMLMLLRWKKRP